jgi:hypothetical protein
MVISPLEAKFFHGQILPQFARLANSNNAVFAAVKFYP